MGRRVPLLAGVLALALTRSPATARAHKQPEPQPPVPPPPVAELARPLAPALVESIGTAVTDLMSRLGIPGLSLAIGDGGELRFAAAWGFADVENAVVAAPDTVYRYASVSKPITAVAALQLVERGRLELDAPAWKYCGAYPPKPWTVTPRQLLCHQGGVRNYRVGEALQLRRYSSVPEALVVFKDDPLAYQPGTSVVYSTYGYCLLGCVVEGAAGRPFAEVLREDVFAPAGMTTTQVDDARVLIPRRANGYVRDGSGELLNSALADVTYKVPGGGLCGTAPDVARFGLALLSGRLVGRATLRQMLTPQRLRTGRLTGFGLGLTVGFHGGRREAWHTGGQERVSTLLYMRPDSGLVVAVLSNLEKAQAPLLDLGRRIADLLTADLVVR
jgi:CubicO group peptidase (beta-lactamase class C family)